MRRLDKIPFEYDVFLSHSSSDKPLVEEIAMRLEDKANLKPFLDKWHLIPGEPWQEALEKAMDQSATCAVFLGPTGLGPWENEEMRSALDERVKNKSLRVIPVLLPGANPRDNKTLPRFLRSLTWVDFRAGIQDSGAFENLVAGILGVAPGRKAAVDAGAGKLKPLIVHPLPPAKSFIGRTKQLKQLDGLWDSGWNGVVSLVGLGGAGKTSIVERFISNLVGTERQPDGVFVWSLYVDQDVDSLIHDAHGYFAFGTAAPGSSGGALRSLMRSLGEGGRFLIVLDGLERVQRPFTDEKGLFGELEDAMLPQMLSRLALKTGRTMCIITTRFPVSDLEPWAGKGYEPISIDQLERHEARQLLEKHQVHGDEPTIDKILDEYGSHALTVDFLGAYLAEFCGGDAAQALTFPQPNVRSAVPEERRLARVFSAYDNVLDPAELGVLSYICVFRFGATPDALYSIFSTRPGPIQGLSKIEVVRFFRRLEAMHMVVFEKDGRYTVHPAVRDHYYNRFTRTERQSSHDGVREYYFSKLSASPSPGKPADKADLDLLEELVYQALEAGQEKSAIDIYKTRLGGVDHLGFTLGEFSRGLRILKMFPQPPSDADMAYYLFNIGDLEGAKTYFRKTGKITDGILMFQGRLPEAAAVGRGFESRAGTARFLMGHSTTVPPSDEYIEDLPYFPAELYLCLDEVENARRRLSVTSRKWLDQRWNDLIPRCHLVEAEILARQGKHAEAKDTLQTALSGILRQGTASWLCVYYLYSGRIHRHDNDVKEAAAAIKEGLHLAERCGFTLYLVDLLIEQARIHLLEPNPQEAARVAERVLNIANTSDKQYGLAAGRAEAILHEALLNIHEKK